MMHEQKIPEPLNLSSEPGDDSPRLSVLLPVRNDGVNIRIMLKMLKAVVEVGFEVLVIHDHPDDDCIEVVAYFSFP